MIPQSLRLTYRLVAGFALLWSAGSPAQVADWFDPADSTLANAAHARSAGHSAADATRGLLTAGVDPAQGVQAVIDTYAQCDAVFDAVAAASSIAPERAGDLVQAAALNPRCPCGGENVWAASRLSNRLRIAHRSNTLEVLPSCGCVGAAAQAAAAALPERADQILAAALDANRRASGIVDSIGQVGSQRGPLGAAGGSLRRQDEQRCRADTNPGDAFDPTTHWQAGEFALGDLPRTRVGACAAPDDSGEATAGSGSASQLLIDGYQSGAGQHALVLFNGGERTLDLGSENYQLELYFPGVTGPGRRLPLTGSVPAGGLFLVAGDRADAAVKARADLLLPSILLEPSEAVVLRRGLEDAGCGCAQLTVAGTLNGLGAVSEAWREQQVEAGRIGRRLVADSVGQVGPEDAALIGWHSPLVAVPLALARATGACAADTNVADAFVDGDWQRDAADAESAVACRQASGTVLIAGYRAGREATTQPVWRVLDLWNDTGAAIDLAAQGYLLEVYGQGEREASRVIPLSGTVERASRYRLAADSAPATIRDQANAVSSDLALEHVDALVLKRLAVREHGQCDVDVYAALRELRAPVPLAPQVVRETPGEPRPDESVTDPNRGGEIASPN